MVSWSDGDSNESFFHDISSSSHDDMKLPTITEDSNFAGIETDTNVFCHMHGKQAEWHVAFEGILTGRRFLVCR
ncbi:hypothetical protein ZWY2020_034904 [Hordeum vulgare]|nr:hypothetical protein ZWY2020_034904 [Hordeum vulgare]